MRDFTPEEKELIINTQITFDCFDMTDFVKHFENDIFGSEIYMIDIWETQVSYLETLRKSYNKTKDERYFIELVRLLPNSYKVVKL